MQQVRPVRTEAVEEALTSAAKRQILAHCIRRPMSTKDLAAKAGLPLPSAYRHVHDLVDLDLLVIERSAMTGGGKPYDLFRARIRSARILLEAESIKVDWSINAALEDRLVHMWKQFGA